MRDAATTKRVPDAPWLGEIPVHWDVKPLFTALRETNERNFGLKERNLLSLSYGRIVRRDIDTVSGLLPESFDTYQIVEPGDIVLRLTDLQNDQRSLRVGLVSERGIITSAYVNLRVIGDHDPRFLFYQLHNADLRKVFYNFGGGVRQSMKYSELKRLPIVIPPLSAQYRIADFLDAATAKIDQLLKQKRRLIEQLEVKRATLVACEFPLPSGSASPEFKGWRFSRLKFLTNQITVGIVITPSKYYVEEGVPCLRSLNIRPMRVTEDEMVYISSESNDLLRKSKIYSGDVVVVRTGQPGTATVVPPEFNGCNCIDLIIIRQPRLNAELLAYFLNSNPAKMQFSSGSSGAIQQHFNIEQAKDVLVPIPPEHEQLSIVRRLDCLNENFDALIEKLEDGIAALSEYRAALISSVLAGSNGTESLLDQKEAAAVCP